MFVRLFFLLLLRLPLPTEFRTRVEGVTVPHTRPDFTVTDNLLIGYRYTTRAHLEEPTQEH